MTRQEMIDHIDLAADAIRQRLVGDPVRAFEYERAAEEARAYAAAGYTGTVPPTLQAWMEAMGWDATTAANDILREAAMFNYALNHIRKSRLVGKYAVRDAATDEEAVVAYNIALSAIKAVG